MNKNIVVQIIALILIIVGTVVVILDRENLTFSPDFIKSKGMWLVIIGLLLSSLYTLFTQKKIKKEK